MFKVLTFLQFVFLIVCFFISFRVTRSRQPLLTPWFNHLLLFLFLHRPKTVCLQITETNTHRSMPLHPLISDFRSMEEGRLTQSWTPQPPAQLVLPTRCVNVPPFFIIFTVVHSSMHVISDQETIWLECMTFYSLKILCVMHGTHSGLEREKKFLLLPVCSATYFYHLPKVQKSLTNPQGRPIVASTNSFISGLSIYIDYIFSNPLFSGFLHTLETLVVCWKFWN